MRSVSVTILADSNFTAAKDLSTVVPNFALPNLIATSTTSNNNFPVIESFEAVGGRGAKNDKDNIVASVTERRGVEIFKSVIQNEFKLARLWMRI